MPLFRVWYVSLARNFSSDSLCRGMGIGFGMLEGMVVASMCCVVCGNGHGSAFLYGEVESTRCSVRRRWQESMFLKLINFSIELDRTLTGARVMVVERLKVSLDTTLYFSRPLRFTSAGCLPFPFSLSIPPDAPTRGVKCWSFRYQPPRDRYTHEPFLPSGTP